MIRVVEVRKEIFLKNYLLLIFRLDPLFSMHTDLIV